MKFATSVHCMDGRIQTPVIEFIRKEFGARYVDVITEPGPCKILSEGTDHPLFESICARIDISTKKHGSNTLFISAHHDCAGNDVSKEIHVEEMIRAETKLRERYPDLEIIKLWIDRDWEVRRI